MAKKFEAITDAVESAKTAMDDLQRREELEALTRVTEILSEYGQALKDFPDIADRIITPCNLVVDVFREGIHLKPGFGKIIAETITPTLATFTKEIAQTQATFRTELSDERAAFQAKIVAERKAFTEEMAKLHESQLRAIRDAHRKNLDDLSHRGHRIPVPPYIVYVVIALLIPLAIYFGATLMAIIADTPTDRLATLSIVFLTFLILLPALIIYLHRQEYL